MDQITHIYTDMELATLVDQYVRRFPQRRHLEKVYGWRHISLPTCSPDCSGCRSETVFPSRRVVPEGTNRVP